MEDKPLGGGKRALFGHAGVALPLKGYQSRNPESGRAFCGVMAEKAQYGTDDARRVSAAQRVQGSPSAKRG